MRVWMKDDAKPPPSVTLYGMMTEVLRDTNRRVVERLERLHEEYPSPEVAELLRQVKSRPGPRQGGEV
jgi:hypothetical protein